MAKKSRRARAKLRTIQQADIERTGTVSSGNITQIKPVFAGSGSAVVQVNRHQHVVPELTRICITAAVLFVIIIALSFFLN